MASPPPRQDIAQRIREVRNRIEALDDRSLADDLVLAALAFAETYYSQ